MIEIWRSVTEWQGYYEVSNTGRVRSVRRCVGNRNRVNDLSGKILQQNHTIGGYCQVYLCRNGKKQSALVHRLVAAAFVENPLSKPHVNHKDGIKNNNATHNLEWVTRQENEQHKVHVLGYTCHIKAAAVASIKLRKPVVGIHISTSERICFNSQTAAAQFFGGDITTIGRALHGKAKTAWGYRWQFMN